MPPNLELPITNSPPAAIAALRTMSRPRPVESAVLWPRIATSAPPAPGPASATSSRTLCASLMVRATAKSVPSGVWAKTLSTSASTTSTRSAPSMLTGVGSDGIETARSRPWSAANADQKATRSATTLAASHERPTVLRTGRRASLTTASTVRSRWAIWVRRRSASSPSVTASASRSNAVTGLHGPARNCPCVQLSLSQPVRDGGELRDRGTDPAAQQIGRHYRENHQHRAQAGEGEPCRGHPLLQEAGDDRCTHDKDTAIAGADEHHRLGALVPHLDDRATRTCALDDVCVRGRRLRRGGANQPPVRHHHGRRPRRDLVEVIHQGLELALVLNSGHERGDPLRLLAGSGNGTVLSEGTNQHCQRDQEGDDDRRRRGGHQQRDRAAHQ